MTQPVQRPGRSKQDYRTPPEFLAAVKRRLNIRDFDADLAADDENYVAPVYFTKEDSAFAQPTWYVGYGWNWLNPPFADITPWVRRAHADMLVDETQTAVLIPASVGANWWRDHVHHRAKVLFLNGRLKFVGCEDYYPKDCALLLYSPVLTPDYDVWSWAK